MSSSSPLNSKRSEIYGFSIDHVQSHYL